MFSFVAVFVASPPIPWQESRSGCDDSHAILRAQSISGSLLGAGIVPPNFVGKEPVFVTTRRQGHTESPDTVRTFMHWRGVGVPVVEVAGQRHLPSGRRRKGERSRTASELFVFRRCCLHFHSF